MMAQGSKSDGTEVSYHTQTKHGSSSYVGKQPSYDSPEAEPQLNPNTSNDTEPMFKEFNFSDATIRRGFIRKVYGLLSVCCQMHTSYVIVVIFEYCTFNQNILLN